MNNILLEQHMKTSRQILAESVSGMTKEQRRIVEGVYNDLKPLIEASLSPNQINQLFGEIEKTAAASGANRTMLGKGVDTVKKADEIINKAGRWLQDTTPVKMADQKFENLKAKISAKFPELDKKLTGLGSWMKANPGKTAFVIGLLTAVSSLAGGPIGGAIAGQVLRGAAELVKGEKLSTAVGKGIKTAVLGYLTGALADKVGSWLSGLRADVVPVEDGLVQISFKGAREIKAGGMEWTREFNIQNMTVVASDREYAMELVRQVNAGDINAFDELYNLARTIKSSDYKAMLADISAEAKNYALQNDAAFQALEVARKGITAAAQGAVAGTGAMPKKESVYRQTRPLSEGQVYLTFNRIEKLYEGPLDWIKKGAEKLTTKYTADTLNSAWQKAGSPTDSEELRGFLEKQGVDSDVINTVYSQMKIDSAKKSDDPSAGPNAAPAADVKTLYAQVKTEVEKLKPGEKKKLMAYLQKQLGTT